MRKSRGTWPSCFRRARVPRNKIARRAAPGLVAACGGTLRSTTIGNHTREGRNVQARDDQYSRHDGRSSREFRWESVRRDNVMPIMWQENQREIRNAMSGL